MKGKTTAILLATVLASPLGMAKVAKASGLEAEMRFRDSTTRAEAEVEVGQRTKNGATTSKLELEFEISQLLPTTGTASPPSGVDFTLNVGGVTCKMSSMTDPVIKTIVKGTQTFQRVSFHGSFAQVTPPPATPLPDKGLDCSGDPGTLKATDTVDLTVTGLQPDVVFPQRTLKLDD
jgi:hypothetical protein